MRSFEMKKTQRFWSIERDKKKITVRYGKVGGKATARTSESRDVGEALRKYQQQIGEKVRAGYQETTTDDVPELDATGQALEGALVENPDDLATLLAFADYLSEQADPRHQARSEFIRVQLQLEDEKIPTAQRKKLKKREKELLAANERRWLGWRLYDVLFDGGSDTWIYGGLGKPDEMRGYRRGWLDRLETSVFSDELGRILTSSPGVRLLRELMLEGLYDVVVSETLADVGALANLRVLKVQDGADEEEITPFIAQLPRLEVLRLEAMDLPLGGLFSLTTFGNLRELHVEDAEGYDVPALAKNPTLGRLQRLALIPGWTETHHGPHVGLKDVRALASSKHLKSLTSLTIHRTDAGDDGVEAIIRSGLLSRLSELDLSNGCITDRGALALAAAPGFLALKALTLTYNRLTTVGINALQRPGLTLDVSDQQIEDEDGYSDDYLYDDWDFDGDWDFDDDWE